MRTHLDAQKRLTETEGRDFSWLTISYIKGALRCRRSITGRVAAAHSGRPEEIADDIRTFVGIGVHELIFDFRGQSIAESVERLQRFAAEVMPLGG